NVKELEQTMLKITDELTREEAEESNMLSLLIQHMIKESSNKHIDKIQSFKKLVPHFGFIKLKWEDHSMAIKNDTNCFLIEHTNEGHMYLYHGVQSETEWEQVIDSVKNRFVGTTSP